MSIEVFSDDCPGCRPAMINLATGERFPDDSPPMLAVLEVWKNTTVGQRLAWHRVTCQNSRTEMDLLFCQGLQRLLQTALERIVVENGLR